MHLTWQPTSPKRFHLQNAHVLKKVASESETDRAERLLDLIEDEEDSMDYIHMNENYREQILDLADSLLIMLEQHVLKYAVSEFRALVTGTKNQRQQSIN